MSAARLCFISMLFATLAARAQKPRTIALVSFDAAVDALLRRTLAGEARIVVPAPDARFYDCERTHEAELASAELARRSGAELIVSGRLQRGSDDWSLRVCVRTPSGRPIQRLHYSLHDPQLDPGMLSLLRQELQESMRRAASFPPPAVRDPTPAAALPPDGARHFGAVYVDTPPVIDGRLDDVAWQSAPADERFTQNFPDERAPPTERTELRVLYTRDTLIIGIRCWDKHAGEIVERLTRRDRDTAADQVFVDISSKNDQLSAYHFGVNVAGVLVDGVRFGDTDYSSEWDGFWRGAASRDAQGWSAELAIPITELRYERGIDHFGFQVRRVIQRRQEIDEWAYVPRTAGGEVSYYGTLDGLRRLQPHRLFRLGAYAAGRLIFTTNQPPLSLLDYNLEVGADLKVGLTPSLILDVTVNPDFGQVEADQVLLNLTTFEVFYPEKRPFFIEGSDIFATPFQQYYSRRIGAAPPSPYLATGDALASPAPNGRIWTALKLSGVLGRRTSIGVMEALTAERDAQVVRADGRREVTPVDPLTNFGVLRIKREFGAHSHFAVTGTAANRFESATPQLCPDGTSPVDGRCTHDAYTLGTDLNLRSSDGVWGGFVNGVTSFLSGGPLRTLPDGTTLQSGDVGFGVNAEVGRYGGRIWRARLSYLGASPKLDLNDAGYLEQANLHQGVLTLGLRRTRPLGAIQESSLDATVTYIASWDGAQLAKRAELGSYTVFRNLWELYLGFRYDLDHDDNREARDGAVTERAGGFKVAAYLRSNPQKRFFFDAALSVSQRLRGQALDGFTTLSFRVIPQLELDLVPGFTWSYGDPRWFDTEHNADGSRSYFFGDLESSSVSVTLRATYTFLPNLSLQAYAQLFLAGGHFSQIQSAAATGTRPILRRTDFQDAPLPGANPDFREGALNINVVLRWEYLTGSTLLLVYTRAQAQTAYDPIEGSGMPRIGPFANGPATDVLMLKVNYLWN